MISISEFATFFCSFVLTLIFTRLCITCPIFLFSFITFEKSSIFSIFQNNSDQLPAFPAAAASNTMAGLVQSQTNQFIPPYLPPQYGSVVVEGMKTETPIQAQQAMSYQSLQAVSSDHHGFSQLINVSQTSTLPPIPFLTNLSTQAPQSNGGMTQNGVSTTQVFSASPENASKSFFVQMENGSYQVRFGGLADVESVKNQTRIHEIPSSISPPVTDSACECNNVTFLG